MQDLFKRDFSQSTGRRLRIASVSGGILGIVLAPIMVTIKYMTGWSVVPEPGWTAAAKTFFASLLELSSPSILWSFFGSFYTLALMLMLGGLVLLGNVLADSEGHVRTKGYWVLLLGFILVIPGDLIHSLTWHQNGLTIPTPGTNPVANTAYAVHMMGMNLVMMGCMITGITSLRRGFLATWLSWMFILVFPSAVLASTTILPTTPSGALILFAGTMVAFGYSHAPGNTVDLVAV